MSASPAVTTILICSRPSPVEAVATICDECGCSRKNGACRAVIWRGADVQAESAMVNATSGTRPVFCINPDFLNKQAFERRTFQPLQHSAFYCRRVV